MELFIVILQINTNGVISFTAPVPTFTPEPFPIPGRFLIAPFWADVDTRGTGEIYFKETIDEDLLIRATAVIKRATYQAAGLSRFTPKWMLIATWYQVGYFSSHTDLVIIKFYIFCFTYVKDKEIFCFMCVFCIATTGNFDEVTRNKL